MMDPAWITTLGYAVVCLLCAGLFMTLYASLTVSQDAGLARLEEKFPTAERRLQRRIPQWDLLRVSAFIAALLSAIGAVSLGVGLVNPESAAYPWGLAGILLGVTALLSLLLHLIPRVMAESYADLMSVHYLPAAVIVSRLLWPLAWPLARLEQRLLQWVRTESDDDNRPTHEEEILHLVDQAQDEDMEEEERELIKSVFDFGDTIARECMTPRIHIDGLTAGLTVREACDAIQSSPHSRFPVYQDTLDRIQGAVHLKDLLRLLYNGPRDAPIAEAVKPVISVSENLLISELLQLLRGAQAQLAILVDDYGGTAGLITVEDIIEELVGDIHDEYDTDSLKIRTLPGGGILVNARMPVYDVNKQLDLKIPEDDEYDSLGGYLYHLLGRIPRAGETVDGADTRFTIHTADERRVQTVEVAPPAAGPNPD